LSETPVAYLGGWESVLNSPFKAALSELCCKLNPLSVQSKEKHSLTELSSRNELDDDDEPTDFKAYTSDALKIATSYFSGVFTSATKLGLQHSTHLIDLSGLKDTALVTYSQDKGAALLTKTQGLATYCTDVKYDQLFIQCQKYCTEIKDAQLLAQCQEFLNQCQQYCEYLKKTDLLGKCQEYSETKSSILVAQAQEFSIEFQQYAAKVKENGLCAQSKEIAQQLSDFFKDCTSHLYWSLPSVYK